MSLLLDYNQLIDNDRNSHDSMESHCECITACSLDDDECVTQCVEIPREPT